MRICRSVLVAMCLQFSLIAGGMGQNQPSGSQTTANPDIQTVLIAAKALNEGTIGIPNYLKAFQFFQTASQQGSQEANAWLGSMYLAGHGTPMDLGKATSLIQSAASKSDPVGLRFLGLLYQSGQGVPQDPQKAQLYYEQAVKLNDANACGRLGMMYLLGLGIPADYGKGKQLLEKGASAGDSWAKVELGRLYATSSTKQDFAAALVQYTEAAAIGNRVAAFRAGRLYEQGKGAAQDYSKAYKYYQQSARYGYPLAQFAIANMLKQGLGLPANVTLAFAYYSLAADQGNSEASLQLQILAQTMTPDQVAEGTKSKATLVLRPQSIPLGD